VKYYPNIDASLVTANISKKELQNIAGNLTLKDVYPSAKTVAGSIGIEPNNFITSAEGRDISIKSNEFMSSGIRQIIANSDGAKSAYCRTGVTSLKQKSWTITRQVIIMLETAYSFKRTQPQLSSCPIFFNIADYFYQFWSISLVWFFMSIPSFSQ
jgi:hypothetical protein